MDDSKEKVIADIINSAALFSEGNVDVAVKPKLLVEHTSPDNTVRALVELFAGCGQLFDRGVPVQLVKDLVSGGMVAHALTADSLVMLAHTLSRPYSVRTDEKGLLEAKDVRLPRPTAVMYKDLIGGWRLPPLLGIAATPLLDPDGSICSVPGYNSQHQVWLDDPPDVAGIIPIRPTYAEALHALKQVREVETL